MQALLTKGRGKWWMLSFAFFATVINYLSRQTLSVMAPVLLQQFRISATSYTGCIALISTATFGYSGALANLLAVPGDVFPKGAVASIWGFASMGGRNWRNDL
jgi:ACS family hexuronate transporter-like MFS transporter